MEKISAVQKLEAEICMLTLSRPGFMLAVENLKKYETAMEAWLKANKILIDKLEGLIK